MRVRQSGSHLRCAGWWGGNLGLINKGWDRLWCRRSCSSFIGERNVSVVTELAAMSMIMRVPHLFVLNDRQAGSYLLLLWLRIVWSINPCSWSKPTERWREIVILSAVVYQCQTKRLRVEVERFVVGGPEVQGEALSIILI